MKVEVVNSVEGDEVHEFELPDGAAIDKAKASAVDKFFPGAKRDQYRLQVANGPRLDVEWKKLMAAAPEFKDKVAGGGAIRLLLVLADPSKQQSSSSSSSSSKKTWAPKPAAATAADTATTPSSSTTDATGEENDKSESSKPSSGGGGLVAARMAALKAEQEAAAKTTTSAAKIGGGIGKIGSDRLSAATSSSLEQDPSKLLEKVQKGGAASSLRSKMKEQGQTLLEEAAHLVSLGSYGEAVEMFTTAERCFKDACDSALAAKAQAGREDAKRMLSMQGDQEKTAILAKEAYDNGKENMAANDFEVAVSNFTQAIQLYTFCGNKPWIAKAEAAKKEATRKILLASLKGQCAELADWMVAYSTDESEAWEPIDISSSSSSEGNGEESGKSLMTGVKLAQMMDPEGGQTTFRARGVITAPPKVLSSYVWDNARRSEWDSRFASSKSLETLDSGLEIAHLLMDVAADSVQDRRDFVVARYKTEKDRVQVVVECSIEREDVVSDSDTVRGQILMCGWTFAPAVGGGDDSCDAMFISQVDMGGVESAVSSVVPNALSSAIGILLQDSRIVSAGGLDPTPPFLTLKAKYSPNAPRNKAEGEDMVKAAKSLFDLESFESAAAKYDEAREWYASKKYTEDAESCKVLAEQSRQLMKQKEEKERLKKEALDEANKFMAEGVKLLQKGEFEPAAQVYDKAASSFFNAYDDDGMARAKAGAAEARRLFEEHGSSLLIAAEEGSVEKGDTYFADAVAAMEQRKYGEAVNRFSDAEAQYRGAKDSKKAESAAKKKKEAADLLAKMDEHAASARRAAELLNTAEKDTAAGKYADAIDGLTEAEKIFVEINDEESAEKARQRKAEAEKLLNSTGVDSKCVEMWDRLLTVARDNKGAGGVWQNLPPPEGEAASSIKVSRLTGSDFLPIWKASATIEAPPAVVLSDVWAPENRQIWDRFCREPPKVIQTFSDTRDVIQVLVNIFEQTEGKGDYLICRFMGEDGSTTGVVEFSIVRPDVPVKTRCPRAEVQLAGWVVDPANEEGGAGGSEDDAAKKKSATIEDVDSLCKVTSVIQINSMKWGPTACAPDPGSRVFALLKRYRTRRLNANFKSLMDEASALAETGDFAEAIQKLQALVDSFRQVGDEDGLKQAQSALKDIQLRKKTADARSALRDKAKTALNEAEAHLTAKKFPNALTRFEDARIIAEEEMSPPDQEIAGDAISGKKRCQAAQEEHDTLAKIVEEGEGLLKQSLAILKQVGGGGGDGKGTAAPTDNNNVEDLARAENLALQAKDVFEKGEHTDGAGRSQKAADHSVAAKEAELELVEAEGLAQINGVDSLEEAASRFDKAGDKFRDAEMEIREAAARKRAKECRDLKRKREEAGAKAAVLISEADAFFAESSFEKALERFKDAEKLFTEATDAAGQARAAAGLAETERQLKLAAEKRAETEAEIKQLLQQAETLFAAGGKWHDAANLFGQAEKKQREIDDKPGADESAAKQAECKQRAKLEETQLAAVRTAESLMNFGEAAMGDRNFLLAEEKFSEAQDQFELGGDAEGQDRAASRKADAAERRAKRDRERACDSMLRCLFDLAKSPETEGWQPLAAAAAEESTKSNEDSSSSVTTDSLEPANASGSAALALKVAANPIETATAASGIRTPAIATSPKQRGGGGGEFPPSSPKQGGADAAKGANSNNNNTLVRARAKIAAPPRAIMAQLWALERRGEYDRHLNMITTKSLENPSNSMEVAHLNRGTRDYVVMRKRGEIAAGSEDDDELDDIKDNATIVSTADDGSKTIAVVEFSVEHPGAPGGLTKLSRDKVCIAGFVVEPSPESNEESVVTCIAQIQSASGLMGFLGKVTGGGAESVPWSPPEFLATIASKHLASSSGEKAKKAEQEAATLMIQTKFEDAAAKFKLAAELFAKSGQKDLAKNAEAAAAAALARGKAEKERQETTKKATDLMAAAEAASKEGRFEDAERDLAAAVKLTENSTDPSVKRLFADADAALAVASDKKVEAEKLKLLRTQAEKYLREAREKFGKLEFSDADRLFGQAGANFALAADDDGVQRAQKGQEQCSFAIDAESKVQGAEELIKAAKLYEPAAVCYDEAAELFKQAEIEESSKDASAKAAECRRKDRARKKAIEEGNAALDKAWEEMKQVGTTNDKQAWFAVDTLLADAKSNLDNADNRFKAAEFDEGLGKVVTARKELDRLEKEEQQRRAQAKKEGDRLFADAEMLLGLERYREAASRFTEAADKYNQAGPDAQEQHQTALDAAEDARKKADIFEAQAAARAAADEAMKIGEEKMGKEEFGDAEESFGKAEELYGKAGEGEAIAAKQKAAGVRKAEAGRRRAAKELERECESKLKRLIDLAGESGDKWTKNEGEEEDPDTTMPAGETKEGVWISMRDGGKCIKAWAIVPAPASVLMAQVWPLENRETMWKSATPSGKLLESMSSTQEAALIGPKSEKKEEEGEEEGEGEGAETKSDEQQGSAVMRKRGEANKALGMVEFSHPAAVAAIAAAGGDKQAPSGKIGLSGFAFFPQGGDSFDSPSCKVCYVVEETSPVSLVNPEQHVQALLDYHHKADRSGRAKNLFSEGEMYVAEERYLDAVGKFEEAEGCFQDIPDEEGAKKSRDAAEDAKKRHERREGQKLSLEKARSLLNEGEGLSGAREFEGAVVKFDECIEVCKDEIFTPDANSSSKNDPILEAVKEIEEKAESGSALAKANMQALAEAQEAEKRGDELMIAGPPPKAGAAVNEFSLAAEKFGSAIVPPFVEDEERCKGKRDAARELADKLRAALSRAEEAMSAGKLASDSREYRKAAAKYGDAAEAFEEALQPPDADEARKLQKQALEDQEEIDELYRKYGEAMTQGEEAVKSGEACGDDESPTSFFESAIASFTSAVEIAEGEKLQDEVKAAEARAALNNVNRLLKAFLEDRAKAKKEGDRLFADAEMLMGLERYREAASRFTEAADKYNQAGPDAQEQHQAALDAAEDARKKADIFEAQAAARAAADEAMKIGEEKMGKEEFGDAEESFGKAEELYGKAGEGEAIAAKQKAAGVRKAEAGRRRAAKELERECENKLKRLIDLAGQAGVAPPAKSDGDGEDDANADAVVESVDEPKPINKNNKGGVQVETTDEGKCIKAWAIVPAPASVLMAQVWPLENRETMWKSATPSGKLLESMSSTQEAALIGPKSEKKEEEGEGEAGETKSDEQQGSAVMRKRGEANKALGMVEFSHPAAVAAIAAAGGDKQAPSGKIGLSGFAFFPQGGDSFDAPSCKVCYVVEETSPVSLVNPEQHVQALLDYHHKADRSGRAKNLFSEGEMYVAEERYLDAVGKFEEAEGCFQEIPDEEGAKKSRDAAEDAKKRHERREGQKLSLEKARSLLNEGEGLSGAREFEGAVVKFDECIQTCDNVLTLAKEELDAASGGGEQQQHQQPSRNDANEYVSGAKLISGKAKSGLAHAKRKAEMTQAAAKAEETGDKSMADKKYRPAEGAFGEASALWGKAGDDDAADRCRKKALDAAEAAKKKEAALAQAQVAYANGQSMEKLQRFEEAADKYQVAAPLFQVAEEDAKAEQAKEAEERCRKLLADRTANMENAQKKMDEGNAAMNAAKYAPAEDCFAEALEFFRAAPDAAGVSKAEENRNEAARRRRREEQRIADGIKAGDALLAEAIALGEKEKFEEGSRAARSAESRYEEVGAKPQAEKAKQVADELAARAKGIQANAQSKRDGARRLQDGEVFMASEKFDDAKKAFDQAAAEYAKVGDADNEKHAKERAEEAARRATSVAEEKLGDLKLEQLVKLATEDTSPNWKPYPTEEEGVEAQRCFVYPAEEGSTVPYITIRASAIIAAAPTALMQTIWPTAERDRWDKDCQKLVSLVATPTTQALAVNRDHDRDCVLQRKRGKVRTCNAVAEYSVDREDAPTVIPVGGREFIDVAGFVVRPAPPPPSSGDAKPGTDPAPPSSLVSFVARVRVPDEATASAEAIGKAISWRPPVYVGQLRRLFAPEAADLIPRAQAALKDATAMAMINKLDDATKRANVARGLFDEAKDDGGVAKADQLLQEIADKRRLLDERKAAAERAKRRIADGDALVGEEKYSPAIDAYTEAEEAANIAADGVLVALAAAGKARAQRLQKEAQEKAKLLEEAAKSENNGKEAMGKKERLRDAELFFGEAELCYARGGDPVGATRCEQLKKAAREQAEKEEAVSGGPRAADQALQQARLLKKAAQMDPAILCAEEAADLYNKLGDKKHEEVARALAAECRWALEAEKAAALATEQAKSLVAEGVSLLGKGETLTAQEKFKEAGKLVEEANSFRPVPAAQPVVVAPPPAKARPRRQADGDESGGILDVFSDAVNSLVEDQPPPPPPSAANKPRPKRQADGEESGGILDVFSDAVNSFVEEKPAPPPAPAPAPAPAPRVRPKADAKESGGILDVFSDAVNSLVEEKPTPPPAPAPAPAPAPRVRPKADATESEGILDVFSDAVNSLVEEKPTPPPAPARARPKADSSLDAVSDEMAGKEAAPPPPPQPESVLPPLLDSFLDFVAPEKPKEEVVVVAHVEPEPETVPAPSKSLFDSILGGLAGEPSPPPSPPPVAAAPPPPPRRRPLPDDLVKAQEEERAANEAAFSLLDNILSPAPVQEEAPKPVLVQELELVAPLSVELEEILKQAAKGLEAAENLNQQNETAEKRKLAAELLEKAEELIANEEGRPALDTINEVTPLLRELDDGINLAKAEALRADAEKLLGADEAEDAKMEVATALYDEAVALKDSEEHLDRAKELMEQARDAFIAVGNSEAAEDAAATIAEIEIAKEEAQLEDDMASKLALLLYYSQYDKVNELNVNEDEERPATVLCELKYNAPVPIYKAFATIDADPQVLSNEVWPVETRHDWEDRSLHAHVLEPKDATTETMYSLYDMRSPLLNTRDFVFLRVRCEPDANTVVVMEYSIPPPPTSQERDGIPEGVPRTEEIVRADMVVSGFVLTGIPGEDENAPMKTHCVYVAQADMAGNDIDKNNKNLWGEEQAPQAIGAGVPPPEKEGLVSSFFGKGSFLANVVEAVTGAAANATAVFSASGMVLPVVDVFDPVERLRRKYAKRTADAALADGEALMDQKAYPPAAEKFKQAENAYYDAADPDGARIASEKLQDALKKAAAAPPEEEMEAENVEMSEDLLRALVRANEIRRQMNSYLKTPIKTLTPSREWKRYFIELTYKEEQEEIADKWNKDASAFGANLMQSADAHALEVVKEEAAPAVLLENLMREREAEKLKPRPINPEFITEIRFGNKETPPPSPPPPVVIIEEEKVEVVPEPFIEKDEIEPVQPPPPVVIEEPPPPPPVVELPTEPLSKEAMMKKIQAAMRLKDFSNLSASQVFQSIDEDKSGTLTPEEIRLGLGKLYGDVGEEIIVGLCEMLDTDQSGLVDLDEFADACDELRVWNTSTDPRFAQHQKDLIKRVRKSLVDANEMDFRKVFEEYRQGENDTLTAVDFKRMMKTINPALSPIQLTLLFRSADVDNDGSIEFDEFYDLLMVL